MVLSDDFLKMNFTKFFLYSEIDVFIHLDSLHVLELKDCVICYNDFALTPLFFQNYCRLRGINVMSEIGHI